MLLANNESMLYRPEEANKEEIRYDNLCLDCKTLARAIIDFLFFK